MPELAFLICRFWLIDAWWWLGRREEARDLFVDALGYRNRYGCCPKTSIRRPASSGELPSNLFLGGIILTAMRLSRSWEDRYWRG